MSQWIDFFMETYPKCTLSRRQVGQLFAQFNGEYDQVVEHYEGNLKAAIESGTTSSQGQRNKSKTEHSEPIIAENETATRNNGTGNESLSQVAYDYVDRSKKKRLGAFGFMEHNTALKAKEQRFLNRQAHMMSKSAADLMREGYQLSEIKGMLQLNQRGVETGTIFDQRADSNNGANHEQQEARRQQLFSNLDKEPYRDPKSHLKSELAKKRNLAQMEGEEEHQPRTIHYSEFHRQTESNLGAVNKFFQSSNPTELQRVIESTNYEKYLKEHDPDLVKTVDPTYMWVKLGDLIVEETSTSRDNQKIPENSMLEVFLEDFQEPRDYLSKKKKKKSKKDQEMLLGRIYLTYGGDKVVTMTNRFSKSYFLLLRMDYIKMAVWVVSSKKNLWNKYELTLQLEIYLNLKTLTPLKQESVSNEENLEDIKQDLGQNMKLFKSLFDLMNLDMDERTRNYIQERAGGKSNMNSADPMQFKESNKKPTPMLKSERKIDSERRKPHTGMIRSINNLCGGPEETDLKQDITHSSEVQSLNAMNNNVLSSDDPNLFRFLEDMEDKNHHITLESSNQMLTELGVAKFTDFELLEHQKVGLVWMLEREQFYEHVKELVPSYKLSEKRTEMKNLLHPLWRELILKRDIHCPVHLKHPLEKNLERNNKRSQILRGHNKFCIYLHKMSGQLTPDFPHVGSHIDFFGGLLADEMGLGKTILLLAHIGVSKLFSSSHQQRILESHLASKLDTDVKIMENLGESDFKHIEKESKRKSILSRSRGKIRETGRGASRKRATSAGLSKYRRFRSKSKIRDKLPKNKINCGLSVSFSQSQTEGESDLEIGGSRRFRVAEKNTQGAGKGKSLNKKQKNKKKKKKGKSRKKNPKTKTKKRKLGGLGGNLIVLPTMLLSQWADEIEAFFKKGFIRYFKYYGNNKTRKNEDLTQYDIILTTYGVVRSDFFRKSESRKKKENNLFQFTFLRVICDESTAIHNRKTGVGKAVQQLKAMAKWLVTGTPIQNGLDDLYSFVSFLKYQPWCTFSLWKEFITDKMNFGKKERQKLARNVEMGIHGQEAKLTELELEIEKHQREAEVVVTNLLKPMMLRRSKQNLKKIFKQNNLKQIIEPIEMDREQSLFYQKSELGLLSTFQEFEKDGTLKFNMISIFALISKLRQICDHKDIFVFNSARRFKDLEQVSVKIQKFVEKRVQQRKMEGVGDSKKEEKTRANFLTSQIFKITENIRNNDQKSQECIICCDLIEEPAVTFCMHTQFCMPCLKKALVENPKCPHCKTELNPDKDLFLIPLYENFEEVYQQKYVPSPKIDKLREIALKHSDSKIVVFSHFISMLKMIKRDFSKKGRDTEFICGATPEKARSEIIKRFKKSHKSTILLISIKVGGFGLNLTEANVVVILEPWWNPAIEDQAIDRVNRIGQKKKITVYRFITKNSIEERIATIRDSKKALFENTIGTAENKGLLKKKMNLDMENLLFLIKRKTN